MTMATWGLLWMLSFKLVNALPQPQASVTLFSPEDNFDRGDPVTMFLPQGMVWAQPVGTASDALVTTFMLVDVISATGILKTAGSFELRTTTTTFFGTIAVSASGWSGYIPAPTLNGFFPNNLDCHLTASSLAECVQVGVGQIQEGGSTVTRTYTDIWTGSEVPWAFPILTGTPPSPSNLQSQLTVTSPTLNSQTVATTTMEPTLTSFSNAAFTA